MSHCVASDDNDRLCHLCLKTNEIQRNDLCDGYLNDFLSRYRCVDGSATDLPDALQRCSEHVDCRHVANDHIDVLAV